MFGQKPFGIGCLFGKKDKLVFTKYIDQIKSN